MGHDPEYGRYEVAVHLEDTIHALDRLAAVIHRPRRVEKHLFRSAEIAKPGGQRDIDVVVVRRGHQRDILGVQGWDVQDDRVLA